MVRNRDTVFVVVRDIRLLKKITKQNSSRTAPFLKTTKIILLTSIANELTNLASPEAHFATELRREFYGKVKTTQLITVLLNARHSRLT